MWRPYQLPIIEDHHTGILILHWARQIGKSFVLAGWAVERLLTRPGRLVTVLSNSRENGAEFVAKCAEVCRLTHTKFESKDKSPSAAFKDLRMEVRIRARRKWGRIKVLAANPRTARGFSGDLILDEFAFHEDAEAIWAAAEPILSSNPDFLCRIASTGNGKHNLFYRMVSGAYADDATDETRNEHGTDSPQRRRDAEGAEFATADERKCTQMGEEDRKSLTTESLQTANPGSTQMGEERENDECRMKNPNGELDVPNLKFQAKQTDKPAALSRDTATRDDGADERKCTQMGEEDGRNPTTESLQTATDEGKGEEFLTTDGHGLTQMGEGEINRRELKDAASLQTANPGLTQMGCKELEDGSPSPRPSSPGEGEKSSDVSDISARPVADTSSRQCREAKDIRDDAPTGCERD